MKHLLLLFLLLCYASTVHAQYDFYKTYTGNVSTGFLKAKQLNTYHENTVASWQTLASINHQGQVNWSKQVYFDSTASNYPAFPIVYRELIPTHDGGFIGLSNDTNSGIITRFDSLGNEIWSKLFSRNNQYISFDAGIRTSSNEYILTIGSIQGSSSGNVIPFEWIKIDINGNVIWHRSHYIPFNGAFLTIIKENGLGYLVGTLDGKVAQMDFNGNILWIRKHTMVIDDIFSVSNNEYIIVGAALGYTDYVWTRVTNGGINVWSKILPGLNSYGISIFHEIEAYQQLSDGNMMDIKATPSLTTPNAADIGMIKLNTQTGDAMWQKRYLSNMPVAGVAYVRDYAVITDSIFSLFAFSNAMQNQNIYGHYMRIDVGYDANPTGCLTQDLPVPTTSNTTITYSVIQWAAQTPTYTIQDTTFFIADIPFTENTICENGVAANFLVDDYLLCVNDCINITDTSSGAITSYEWTFFGTDTTYHYTEFPPQICYTDTGTFSIQLIVSDGFVSDTTRKTIQVFDLSGLSLGNDTTFCQGEFIAAGFSIPDANFLWNTGDVTPFLFINTAGTYSVEITQAACYATDTIVVTTTDIPVVDLGNDTAFCDVDSFLLDATILNGTYNYLWQDNSTNSQLIATTSGLYSATITDTLGCENSDDILISFAGINIDLGNDTILCQGETLTLDATNPDANYLWNNNSTDSILIVNTSGIYSVEVNQNNCINSDTIEIIVANLPMVDLGNDTTFCNQTEANLIANTPNNVHYLWNTNDTTPSIFVSNSGTYNVTITDSLTNCQATDDVAITLTQTNTFDLGNDTILCDAQSLRLNAFVPNANYLWNNGSTSSEIFVNNNGLYIVEVLIDNCLTADTISVEFISPINLDLGEDKTLCNGESIELNAFDANAESYLWQNNSTVSTMQVTQAGAYFVSVFYNQDCQTSDTIIFTAENEIYPTLPNDTTICQDNSVILNAYQPNAKSYKWEAKEAYFQQHNLNDSVIIATLPGEYKVTISNECRAFTQTITIEETDCGCYPYVPNAFTPNNDGKNDVFQVYTNCLLDNYNLKIFDRWGGILFETDDINESWQGTSQGQILKNGVYVWILTYDAPNEKGVMKRFVRNGSLTLIR